MEFKGLGEWEIASILVVAAAAGIIAFYQTGGQAGIEGISLLVNILLQVALVLIFGTGLLLLLRRIGFYPGIADDFLARRKNDK